MIGDYLEHYFTNNTNLKSEMRTIPFEIEGHVFTFFSDLGVFSKNRIDYGSRVLLQTILKNNRRSGLKILDVGCGYGFLGICLGKLTHSKVVFSDINERALHLCRKNVKQNEVSGEVERSNIYEKIQGKYDLVVTNPPIRAGKKVVLEILNKAKEYLNDDGELWFVIRKDQGVKSILKNLDEGYLWQILERDKGFYCVQAKLH